MEQQTFLLPVTLLDARVTTGNKGQLLPPVTIWKNAAHPTGPPQVGRSHITGPFCLVVTREEVLVSRAVALGCGILNSVPSSAPGSLWYSGKLLVLAKTLIYKL